MKFVDNSDKVRAALSDAVPIALESVGIQAATLCADELENPPRRVDTGRLQNSINYKVQGTSAVIGTNVEYALYVHEGTRYMSPNRFLRNGVERNRAEYEEIINDVFKRYEV